MASSGKTIFLSVFLVFVFCIANRTSAQTGLDDVHITSRLTSALAPSASSDIEISKAEYLANAGTGDNGRLVRPTIHTNVDLVMVPVTITDSLHRPVIGLDQGNFQLYEGKKPQEIKHFSSEDAPISLGIIVDTSGSMANKIDRARDAVTQFCEMANPKDEFFMITFSETPRLVSDFTSSPERIENELLMTGPKGRTALLDAIYLGLQKMRAAQYGRKALLIISDGGDNHSRYTEKEIKSAVKEADVMIYAVGTYDQYVQTQEEFLGPELLKDVTGLTGGQAFTLTNPNQLPAAAKNIGSQLRHQYVLAYRPESSTHDGKWHKISVKLRLPKKLPFFHVEARSGYYAPGE
jgi:Ca-activated chloride channel family protein